MLITNRCPLSYALCNQTVTVYHLDRTTKEVTKVVYKNAFLDFKKTENVDKTGRTESNSFLLIIPGSTQTVFAGDKVVMGDCADIAYADWSKYVPTNTPGMVVVRYVDCKYWNNTMVHLEAGG